MCLAIPARVVEIPEGELAIVELGGVRKETSLALVDGIAVGDWVIVHVGFAIQKLDADEAEKTLALFAALGAAQGDADGTSALAGDTAREAAE
jgi:hydrogenase expression/formation protein HypC